LKIRMSMHIFPGGFQPVAVVITGLELLNEEGTDALVILGMVIGTERNWHRCFPYFT